MKQGIFRAWAATAVFAAILAAGALACYPALQPVAAYHSAAPVYREDRLNVNTATVAQLEALPGIGPEKAAAIVAQRELAGRYRTAQELLQVKGIGPATLDEISDFISMEP